MATFAEQYKKNKSGTTSGGSTFAERFKSSDIGKTVRDDYERKLAERKVTERQRVIDDSNAKAEKYYQEAHGGVLNTVNDFFGYGADKTGFADSPAANMVAVNLKETSKDLFLQGGVDNGKIEQIKRNSALASEIAKKKRENPAKSALYDSVMKDLQAQNNELSGGVGGELKNKTNGQLIGQSIGTAAEAAQAFPFAGLLTRGTAIAGKEGILQGANLFSKQGAINILKNPTFQENALYGGAMSAGEALKQKEGAFGVAKDTAVGTVATGLGALGLTKGFSLIGKGLTNLFEKIGTRPRVQIDETVARETVDEITDIQGKPPTPEEEDAILEAFANGATKEEIITEVGKVKVSDGFEVRPKLAEVVDQLEANGEKLSLEDTMTVKTALDEGKSFEEIQTSLRTPELAVKSTPEPRKVESNTNTPDNGDDAFLKAVETRFKESKTNKFREATKDEKGRFTGSRKGITGDAERDSFAESIQNQIDNTKDDDILRYDLQAIQDKIPNAKTSELLALKAERDALIQERIDNRANDVRPQVTKERKEIYKQELAKDSNSWMEFQIGLKRNGISPMKEFKTRDDMIAYFEKNRGTSKYRKETLAQSFERVSKQKITPEQEAKIIALNKKLFGDEDVKITAQLLTPEGQKAFGVYKNKVIKILDGQADPTDTFYHEAVHKYLDLFTTLDEQKKIYVEARKVWKTDNLDELEEKIAENFIRYAKTNEGVVGTMKVLFDKVIDRIKVALKSESSIEALYKDILEGKAKGKDIDYLLTAKEATKREKEIVSEIKSKERALARMEKATLDEEKFLARQSESTFISDPEEQHNYQSFKDLLRRFKGEKQRQELLNGDASSIKRVLGDKLKSQELDNILYSTDQSKSEDEMLDYFRGIYEKDKEKITSDMLAKKAQKRLESDPDYAKLQDELSSVKDRKLALERAEQKTLDEVNKELAQQKPEVVEPKKIEVEKEVKPKTSVIASRLNEALPEGFKIDESYDPKVIKEEIDKASQAIFKDKEAAIKKAFDPNTNPVERDAILIELSEIAKRDGDFDAVADLFQRRAELIRSGAQSLNMEKASILLNPQEKYMRDIVNSRLGSVKINGKDLTDVEVSAIRKTVRRETSEATKKAFKIQDAQSLLNSITCT